MLYSFVSSEPFNHPKPFVKYQHNAIMRIGYACICTTISRWCTPGLEDSILLNQFSHCNTFQSQYLIQLQFLFGICTMKSVLTAHKLRRRAEAPQAFFTPSSRDPQKPSTQSQGVNDYFWYRSSNNTIRLVSSSGSLGDPPKHVNDYIFKKTRFKHLPHPFS